MIMWNFIYLGLFVASRWPFKISKVWKRDIKTLATGSGFGGYFNIRDILVWELKLFLFHWIEMKLMHKITVCIFASWNRINPFITKIAKIGNIEIPLFWWARSPIHVTIYEITRPISISRLSIRSWPPRALMTATSRRRPGSLRGDERAPDTPPANPCAQPKRGCAAFRGWTKVELCQHWYGGSYKAKCFPWCLGGANIRLHIVEYTNSLVVDKVKFAAIGNASYTVTDTRPTTNVAMRCNPDYGVHQLIKPFTYDSPSLFHGRTINHCISTAYFNAVFNELWPALLFHFYVTPASQFCRAFFEHALLSAVTYISQNTSCWCL